MQTDKIVGVYQPWNPYAPQMYVMEDWSMQPIHNQNYTDPDEALFSDSSRPRDQYWFPIRPGQQMGKWDWRGSMKNTYLNTGRDKIKIQGVNIKKGASYALWAIGSHEYKTTLGKLPIKIADFVDREWNVHKNGAIEFMKDWTFLFNSTFWTKGVWLAMGDKLLFGLFPEDQYLKDRFDLDTFVRMKSVATGQAWYDVGTWVYSVKKWQKFIFYLGGSDDVEYKSASIFMFTDIIELSS